MTDITLVLAENVSDQLQTGKGHSPFIMIARLKSLDSQRVEDVREAI